MKKFTYISLFVLLFAILNSCGKNGNTDQNNNSSDSIYVDIYLIPMFGSAPLYGNIEKTPAQLDSISSFLRKSDEIEPNRTLASYMYLEMGYHYMDNGNYDESIRKINQAFLLDQRNPDVYIAFAKLLSLEEDHFAAMDMFDRAISTTDINHNKVLVLPFYLDEAYLFLKEKNDNSFIHKVLEIANNLPEPEEQDDKDLLKKVKDDANLYLNS